MHSSDLTFTAIDFETANQHRTSACSVALALVREGCLLGTMHCPIRPEPMIFSPFNVSIHGITEKDVADASTFEGAWPNILSSIDGPLISHSHFDIEVIEKSLDACSLPCPAIEYYDSVRLAKLMWPNEPNHKLDHICQTLGIPLEHHNAQSDAEACALIAIEVCRIHKAPSLRFLQQKLNFTAGHLHQGCSTQTQATSKTRSRGAGNQAKVKAADMVPTSDTYDINHPMFGKHFVFTGTMSLLTQNDAKQTVADFGGMPQDRVTLETNYLVLGADGYTQYEAGHKSDKMKKAERMQADGMPIEIISEIDFLGMQ